jgi:hypothetical protein
MKKSDLLKQLHESPMFKAAIANVTDPAEKKMIKAFAEQFVFGIADKLLPMVDEIEKDPSARERLAAGLVGVLSGSADPSKKHQRRGK